MKGDERRVKEEEQTRNSSFHISPFALQTSFRPDTPVGRAVRLKPGRLQVRVLLWVLQKTDTRLGRQLADHLGLEPGMLWVRLPPEPLETTNYVLVEQRSARLPVTQEIVGSNPIGDARTRWRGTQTGKAAKLKPS